MQVQHLTAGELARFQSAAVYVAGIDGSGNPQSLEDAVAAGMSGGSGSTRTPSISTVTGDGTVAAGKKYIEFIFSSDFAGTIDGETFAGATDVSYSIPYLPGADTYAALAYTISAGSARLTTIA